LAVHDENGRLKPGPAAAAALALLVVVGMVASVASA
jgi:hypothetical protein